MYNCKISFFICRQNWIRKIKRGPDSNIKLATIQSKLKSNGTHVKLAKTLHATKKSGSKYKEELVIVIRYKFSQKKYSF